MSFCKVLVKTYANGHFRATVWAENEKIAWLMFERGCRTGEVPFYLYPLTVGVRDAGLSG